MRKKIFLIISFIIFLSCSNDNKENYMKVAETNEIISEELAYTQNSSVNGKKILIAYFTWAENTYVANPSSVDINATTSASVLPPGDAGLMARWIQEETGGDLFSIITENKYLSDYDECLNEARRERDNRERPRLTARVNDMNDYDVIFLGFPNWWYTCPMAIFTFLESYDFSGKTVIPFCAHGTGGLSRTVRDIRTTLSSSSSKNYKVLDAIGVYRPEVRNSKNRIIEWVRNLEY